MYSFGSCKRIFKNWIFEIQIEHFAHELWKKLRFCPFFSIKNRFFSKNFHFLALFFYHNRFFRIWQEFWCGDLFDFFRKKIVFSLFSRKIIFSCIFFSLFFPENFFQFDKKQDFVTQTVREIKLKKIFLRKFFASKKILFKILNCGEKIIFFSKTSSVRTDEILFRKTSKNETKFCEKIFDSEKKNHFFWTEYFAGLKENNYFSS